MKILYYNWVDYLDREKRGGGVSHYQRNLLSALESRSENEAHFLSSGIAHTLRPGKPRWSEIRSGNKNSSTRRFQIINAGLMAPAHADYGSPAQVEEPATEAAFMDFVTHNGPYDVIHFNNLEGLPANVLRIKDRWPATRVVLSLHNYYPFCPQVNLWRTESVNCTDSAGGTLCQTCLPVRADPRAVRLAHAVSWELNRLRMGPGTVVFDRVFYPFLILVWRAYRKIMRRRSAKPALGNFAQRRAAMVGLINRHVDAVLCVSDRVRQIAAHHGLMAEKLHTSYIGTAEAEKWETTQPKPRMLRADGTTHLAYMGYMRRDKGFFFLLDALEEMPDDIAARLRLTIAAHQGDAWVMARLHSLSKRLSELRLVNGYTHDGLDDLLADVDLGVVPVVWEDNLPQVAIEMHARHIPLITSDRGGAQELGRCSDLTFRAGDKADFYRVLEAVLEERITPAAYWRNAMVPVTMQAHLAQLLTHYEGTA